MPPFGPVRIFTTLIMPTLNNLSEEQMESPIDDRLYFMRFLGLEWFY